MWDLLSILRGTSGRVPRMWDTGKYSYARGIVHYIGLPRKLRMAVNDHVTGRHLLLSPDARQRVTQRDYRSVRSRVP